MARAMRPGTMPARAQAPQEIVTLAVERANATHSELGAHEVRNMAEVMVLHWKVDFMR